MKRLLAATLTCLVGMVVLVTYQPNIEYSGFETQCHSVVSSGGAGFLGASGGSLQTEVVSGEGEVEAERTSAADRGITDPFFVQRALDADCTDRRVQTLFWAMVLGLLTVLGTAAMFVVGSRQEDQPDTASHLPPTVER